MTSGPVVPRCWSPGDRLGPVLTVLGLEAFLAGLGSLSLSRLTEGKRVQAGCVSEKGKS